VPQDLLDYITLRGLDERDHLHRSTTLGAERSPRIEHQRSLQHEAIGIVGLRQPATRANRCNAFAAYDATALSVTRRPIFVTISSPKNPVK
jgi:hypothetical protein